MQPAASRPPGDPVPAREAARPNGWLLDRLTASAWPPIAGIAAALVVFAAVLRSTPAGLSSLPRFFFDLPSGLNGMPVTYAVGAAGTFALVTLLVVTVVGAALDAAVRTLRARTGTPYPPAHDSGSAWARPESWQPGTAEPYTLTDP